MRKTKAYRQARHERRTHQREAKRRAVKSAYKPRTTSKANKAWSRYMTPAEALAMYLMPNYEIARANQFLQALRRVQQRKVA